LVEEHVVTDDEAGERIDRILAARDASRSRSTIQRWIEDGRVEIDGVVCTSKTKPRAGQHIVVRPAPPPPSDAVPEDIPLSILYEDEHLVVIDKPAGLVVHPAAGHERGTLVNALVFRYGSLDGPPGRPGIVHRLDSLTSGVMVVARTAPAREGLMALFAKHDIDRVYRAIAMGSPPKITYDTPYGRHLRHRKRFTSKLGGKRAVTHVEPIEALYGSTLIECRLETGRTHQIRVHLSEHGFPLLGDPLYSKFSRDPRLRIAAERLQRQALHAAVLGFVHPITKENLRFESELPADFRSALSFLREPA
jgi:23S rRNA pseudouridine1911/1915/1917 synthase